MLPPNSVLNHANLLEVDVPFIHERCDGHGRTLRIPTAGDVIAARIGFDSVRASRKVLHSEFADGSCCRNELGDRGKLIGIEIALAERLVVSEARGLPVAVGDRRHDRGDADDPAACP